MQLTCLDIWLKTGYLIQDWLKEWPFDEMTIWWNDHLMKWPFDEMAIW